MCRLHTLEKLNIYGNLIESVPKSVEKLQNLQKIHLGNCGLSTFPEIICKLPCLKSLPLHGNFIDEISESVIRTWHELSLPALEKLRNSQDLAGLEKPPFAIFQKGSKACLEYYNSVKASSIVMQSLLSTSLGENSCREIQFDPHTKRRKTSSGGGSRPHCSGRHSGNSARQHPIADH